MKTIKVKKILSDKQALKLKGKFLKDKHWNTLIDYDCDGYDINTNQLLFRFRKNAIPFDVLKSGYDAFKDSIKDRDWET